MEIIPTAGRSSGIYRPTQDISVGYSCELQDRTITAHVFTIDPLEFQVAVPERQDGYEAFPI